METCVKVKTLMLTNELLILVVVIVGIFVLVVYCKKLHKRFQLWCEKKDKEYPKYLSGKRSDDADI